MSEDRTKNANYTVNFLDKVDAPEIFADPDARKEFILGLEYDDFKDWLVRINGMARGTVATERSVDGDSGGQRILTPDMLPPEAEDKEPLMALTLDAAKSILQSGKSTQEALDDVSLLFSGVINYVAPV